MIGFAKTEAVAQRFSFKKLSLKISQNLQRNASVESFLITFLFTVFIKKERDSYTAVLMRIL